MRRGHEIQVDPRCSTEMRADVCFSLLLNGVFPGPPPPGGRGIVRIISGEPDAVEVLNFKCGLQGRPLTRPSRCHTSVPLRFTCCAAVAGPAGGGWKIPVGVLSVAAVWQRSQLATDSCSFWFCAIIPVGCSISREGGGGIFPFLASSQVGNCGRQVASGSPGARIADRVKSMLKLAGPGNPS